MFDQFTADARRAVAVARTEARGLEHPEVAPVHLLLSLLGMPDGPLTPLFGDTVTLEAARPLARAALPAAAPVVEKPAFSSALKVLLVQLDHGTGAGPEGVVTPTHLASALLDADDALVIDVIRTARRAAAAAASPAEVPAAPEMPTVEEAPEPPPLVGRRSPAVVAPEPEPEPELVPVPEPVPEPEPEPEPVPEPELVPVPEPVPEVELQVRPLPPARPLEPITPIAAPLAGSRSGPPPASESLREFATTLVRSVAVAAAVGFVVYRRTSRRARRRADRAGRAARVVVR